MEPNSEARQIKIESVAFENANSKCRRKIRLLKLWSTPLEEWVQETFNIEFHDQDNAWVGVVIYKALKKN